MLSIYCCPLFFTVAILIFVGVLRLDRAEIDSRGPHPPLLVNVTPSHSNRTRLNHFAHDLRAALVGPVNVSSRVWPIVRNHFVIPIILRDGKVLVTHHIRDNMEQKNPGYTRPNDVTEMIRVGLDLVLSENLPLTLNPDLPFLLMTSDSSGCEIKHKFDQFGYPRVAWSLPSPAKYGQDWCKSIGIPTYEVWNSFKKYESESSWDVQFQRQSKQYPWSRKIHRAVWRGATTSHGIYKETPSFLHVLSDIPRGKLVQKSILNPSLIDAAFTKFTPIYKGREEELRNTTIFKKIMPFYDQMNFMAIIDIDGNDWSSRFPKLLCTNSIVIKVRVHVYICFSASKNQ